MISLPTLCYWCLAFLMAVKADQAENSTISAGLWSSVLEDWATGHTDRKERILQLPNTSGYYISNRVDALPPPQQNTWSQEYNPPPPPSPGKIVNRPAHYTNCPKQKPTNFMPSGGGLGPSGGGQGSPSPNRRGPGLSPSAVGPGPSPSRKEVSETDLYLLGAIEKLVYRVDFMEKRLKKAEELIYYVMAGNNKRPEPCVKNFTRVGSNCYHFSISRDLDWKAASDACKGLGATLAEMETIEENQDVVTYIQANAPLRGNDYWTGGLNPGLLWIWSNSARPVASGSKSEQQIVSSAANSPLNLGSPTDIKGSGRCLKLAYNPTIRSYSYLGSDCAMKQYFMCEILDKGLSNEIQRISRELKFD